MKIAIIGNGVAGVTVAETIRAKDKNCELSIFSNEPYHFYSRPRLIELLSGKASVEQITIHGAAWYERNNIGLALATEISAIDTGARRLRDRVGKEYRYDTLIIAAGAFSSVPSGWNEGHDNVFALRTIADALMIRQAAASRRKAAVIGGGLLGLEVAGSLLSIGVAVTVIEVVDRLLPRQLDGQGSEVLRTILERKGYTFLTGKRIETIERKNGSLAINLSGGTPVETDMIVVSAGIRPNLDIIQGTGIAHRRGILVDPFMRTNVPGVYACGDVAEFNGAMYGLWQAGREQGSVCGSHIAGGDSEYAGFVASTRLKVAGLELASIGDIGCGEGVTETAERDDAVPLYKKLFWKGGKLCGAILVGNVKEAAVLQQLIKHGEAPQA
jgi:nitrite reductase (NADH) large subunit